MAAPVPGVFLSNVNNPLRILQAVDARLKRPVEFFLFGRAALVLGFTNPPAEAVATKDVDGILPHDFLAEPGANEHWWSALEAANDELEAEGLYLTHLFEEGQIILRADWRARSVGIPGFGLRHLLLRRPATIDLILTKMMRGPDPADMQDVRFYLERESSIGVGELRAAFAAAAGPDVPEIWNLFESAKPIVLEMARVARAA